jgi:hypothetical protein
MSAIKQWILAFFAVAGAFFLAGFGGSAVADVFGFWHIPSAGFCAAFAVVVASYASAPSFKFTLSCLAFVAGAVVAWMLLEPSWYPDMKRYGSLAYEPTHLPIIATYAGGITGLLLVATLRWRYGA